MVVAQPTTTMAPRVRQVLDYIYDEAGSSIASHLAVDVNALRYGIHAAVCDGGALAIYIT